MRRARHVLLAFLLAPLVASCVELEQTLQIHPDGSGTIDIRVRTKKAKIRELEAQMAGFGIDPKKAEAKDPFDVERIAARFKKLDGVRLTKIEKIDDDESEGMHATIAFDSPATLAGAMKALVEGDDTKLGNRMQLWFLSGKDGHVRLVYYPSGRAEYERVKTLLPSFAEMGPQERRLQEQMFGLMKASLEGLKVSYRFKVPGRVIRVDGARKTGETEARYEVDAAAIKTMAEMTKVSALRFLIEFDGKGFEAPLLDREPTDTELDAKPKPASRPAESGKRGTGR